MAEQKMTKDLKKVRRRMKPLLKLMKTSTIVFTISQMKLK